ncbi:MAG: ATP-binding protein [Polyangiaceae bacterium]
MTLELVLMMGLQASGKTTVARARYAQTHEHISQDFLRKGRQIAQRQKALIESALREQRSVVVDNTHASAESRASVMTLGRAAGAKIIGIYMASSMERCRARNSKRHGDACVPEVALRSTLKRLERPRRDEGFDELWYGTLLDDGGFELRDWDETASGATRE